MYHDKPVRPDHMLHVEEHSLPVNLSHVVAHAIVPFLESGRRDTLCHIFHVIATHRAYTLLLINTLLPSHSHAHQKQKAIMQKSTVQSEPALDTTDSLQSKASRLTFPCPYSASSSACY